jgi:hypothetical protein
MSGVSTCPERRPPCAATGARPSLQPKPALSFAQGSNGPGKDS